jgi:hypothetical protein
VTTSNEEFARRMRRKRIPGVKCIHCGDQTHVDDGAHMCAGIPAQRFGNRGHFEETHCEAEPLCLNCTHCDECENEKRIRLVAHSEHQADLEHARLEELKRRDEKERKRAAARALIEADVEAKRISPNTVQQAMESGDPKLLGRLFGHLISQERISITSFQTEHDQFTPQTRFTIQLTGWMEDVLKTAEEMKKRDEQDPMPITRAGVAYDLNAPPAPDPPLPKVVDPSLVGKIKGESYAQLIADDVLVRPKVAEPVFRREYLGTPSHPFDRLAFPKKRRK